MIVFEIDNRDLNTTQLEVFGNGVRLAKFEVDPFELVENAIQNGFEEGGPEGQLDAALALWTKFRSDIEALYSKES